MGSITCECLCNEIADELARESSLKDSNIDGCLTFSKIASRVKQDVNALWRITPVHDRYACKSPGVALTKGNTKCIQKAGRC